MTIKNNNNIYFLILLLFFSFFASIMQNYDDIKLEKIFQKRGNAYTFGRGP